MPASIRKPSSETKSPQPAVGEKITRRELALLAVVLAAGILARLVALSHSAVEHFDEGVYASNIYFGPPEFAYPQQRFYAPPLLPALIELGMIAGLPPNLAALLPSFLAGCGTIASVWWFGRSWFGPPVGLAAASLAALNDFHITLSATALTDVLLGLWLVLAIDAIGRSLLERDFRWAIAAGIYTGLAWWTKYNGWLPLAILAAALPLLALLRFADSGSRRGTREQVFCCAIVAVVAFALWLPFLLTVPSYAAIAANHSRYVVGISGWPNGVARQAANQHVIEGWMSLLSLMAAVAFACCATPHFAWSRGAIALAVTLAIGLAILGAIGSTFVVVTVAGILGIGLLAWRQRANPNDRRAVGLALLAAWWCGLAFATPCYWPYPRLILPWLIASWVGTAILCDWCLSMLTMPVAATWKQAAPVLVVLVAAAAGGWLVRPPHSSGASRDDRQALARIAGRIQSDISLATDDVSPRVVYVFGEPALFFQLRAAGEPVVSAVQTVPGEPATSDGQALPTFLLAGPHAQRDPQFRKQWSDMQDRWELLHEYDYEPSAVVWLDLNDPRKSPSTTSQLDRVRVYRLRENVR